MSWTTTSHVEVKQENTINYIFLQLKALLDPNCIPEIELYFANL